MRRIKLPPWLLTFDTLNRVAAAIAIGWGPAIGSGISAVLYGAGPVAMLRLAWTRHGFPDDRRILLISAAFASFFFAEAISGIANWGDGTLAAIAENYIFLMFPFMYGLLSLTRRADILSALKTGVWTGAFLALAIVLVEFFIIGHPRVAGLAKNPGPFAYLCSASYGISLAFAATATTGRERLIFSLAALSAMIALLMSGMRSFWPMIIIAPLVVVIIFGRAPLRRIGIWPLLGALAAVALVLLAGHDVILSRVEKLIDDYRLIVDQNDYANSLGARLRMWAAGIELVKENPLIGYGPARMKELLGAATALDGGPPLPHSHFHNMFLNVMVRDGILGLFSLIAMLAVPPILMLRAKRDRTGDIGLAIMAITTFSFLSSGIVGNLLSHDLGDSFLIIGTLAGALLIFGPSPRLNETGPVQ